MPDTATDQATVPQADTVPEFTKFRATAQDRADLATVVAFLSARPDRHTRRMGPPGVGMSDAIRYCVGRVAKELRAGRRPR